MKDDSRRGLKQRVVEWVSPAMNIALLWLSVVCAVLRLVRARSLVKRAEHILVMAHGGFAYTVVGPDAMRRLFKGQRGLCVIFEKSQHNPYVGLLWPDLPVLMLPFRWRLRWRGRVHEWSASKPARVRLARWLVRWLRRHTGARLIIQRELQRRIAEVRDVRAVADRYLCHWEIGWWELIKQVRMAEARLPDRYQAKIRARLERFVQHQAKTSGPDKLCCLYLRNRGAGSHHTARRNGAPFDAHLPAIRILIEAGYLVLVTGDCVPPRAYADTFHHRLVCAQWAGIDPRFFSLFAGTESQIWIGNRGGGTVLPVTRRIPMLLIDAFPYGAGLSAWMHYKTVRDAQGRLVHYRRLFAEHAFDWEMPGWTVCDNSAEEIAAAVRAFLRDLQEAQEPEEARRVMASLPDHVMEKHLGGRLSTAWLRLFDPAACPAEAGSL